MEIAKKLFFAGSGNMARAIISGVLKAGLMKSGNIVCNDIDVEKLRALSAEFGISVAEHKKEALIDADIIVLSVKPQNMQEVLEEIKPFVKEKAVIISIAAGITVQFIENAIAKKIAVIRAMPNTPALVLAGATALCKGKNVSDSQLQKAKDLFSAIGKVEILDESAFNAVTALSGSGPAYVFYLCELMAQAGEKLGLDAETAKKFALQTVYGSGKMLKETGIPASILRKNVTSPHGTTEAALKYFDSQNLAGIVHKAMESAAQRSKDLSK